MSNRLAIRRPGLVQRLLASVRAVEPPIGDTQESGETTGNLAAFLGEEEVLPRMLYPGARVDGRYWVEEEIGIGGLCLIHRVRDGDTGQVLALKSLQPAFAAMPFYYDMMLREAELQGHLNHPNILAVNRVIAPGDGRHAILLPLLEGGTLAERIERSGPLGEEEAWLFLTCMLDVLQTMRRSALVHLDIAPDNIMFRNAGVESVQLIDFGLARRHLAEVNELIDERLFCGKWSWASPETVMGGEICPASDLYSLGLVMVYALTGTKRDMGTDFESAAHARQNSPELTDLPAAFRDIIGALLDPNCTVRETVWEATTVSVVR